MVCIRTVCISVFARCAAQGGWVCWYQPTAYRPAGLTHRMSLSVPFLACAIACNGQPLGLYSCAAQTPVPSTPKWVHPWSVQVAGAGAGTC